MTVFLKVKKSQTFIKQSSMDLQKQKMIISLLDAQ
jgi:hypothetical protein